MLHTVVCQKCTDVSDNCTASILQYAIKPIAGMEDPRLDAHIFTLPAYTSTLEMCSKFHGNISELLKY
jgi:hypothetical protein